MLLNGKSASDVGNVVFGASFSKSDVLEWLRMGSSVALSELSVGGFGWLEKSKATRQNHWFDGMTDEGRT